MATQTATEAEGRLERALSELGLSVRSRRGRNGRDLILKAPGGPEILLEVKRSTLPTLAVVEQLKSYVASIGEAGVATVLVADRVPASAREALRVAGVGWLDLRGHLRLVAPPLFIDTDVTPQVVRSTRTAALAGPAGIEVACAILIEPDRPIAIRRLAAELGRAPSTVSEVVKSLRSEGLLPDGAESMLPLFEEVAAHWRVTRFPIATRPNVDDPAIVRALGVNARHLDQGDEGWALGEIMAAARYGAPVAVRADQPLDFYVPSEAVLRRAQHLLGAAPHAHDAAGTVAVAPVPLVCRRRVADGESWPLAHPLFVALDLAQDPGRGREVLVDWDPPERWPRVW